jgi:chromosome segregation ATPase
MRKITLLIICFFFHQYLNAQQSAEQIRAKCQQELDALNAKVSSLNDEYEQIKRDMRAGLYCSKCGSSKTELDKTEGFTKHLNNVKGEAIPASQQQMDAAHNRYQSKYNSLKSQYESKQKSCNSSIQSANKAQQDAQRRQQEENQRKQQDQAQKQQDLQKENQRKQQEEQRQKQQKAIDDYNAKIRQQQQEEAERQARFEAAKQELESDVQSNNQRTEDLRNQAEQKNKLGVNNSGVKSEASNIKNSTNLDRMGNSVFDDASTDYSNLNSEEKSVYQNLTQAVKDFRENVSDRVSNYRSNLFDNSIDYTDSDERPSSGFLDGIRNRVNNRIQSVKNAFDNVQEKYNKYSEPYREAYRKYNEYRDEYEDLRDLAEEKTLLSWGNTHANILLDLVDQTIPNDWESFNNMDTEEMDRNYNKSTKRIIANAIGGILGRLKGEDLYDIGDLMDYGKLWRR